jgi:hypothetical protein
MVLSKKFVSFYPKPSDDDLLLAAEWLDSNEGNPDESDSMKRVAVWLRELASESQDDIIVKQLAKETGSTISRAREVWRNRRNRRPSCH